MWQVTDLFTLRPRIDFMREISWCNIKPGRWCSVVGTWEPGSCTASQSHFGWNRVTLPLVHLPLESAFIHYLTLCTPPLMEHHPTFSICSSLLLWLNTPHHHDSSSASPITGRHLDIRSPLSWPIHYRETSLKFLDVISVTVSKIFFNPKLPNQPDLGGWIMTLGTLWTLWYYCLWATNVLLSHMCVML
jgi:hypothetical protein